MVSRREAIVAMILGGLLGGLVEYLRPSQMPVWTTFVVFGWLLSEGGLLHRPVARVVRWVAGGGSL